MSSGVGTASRLLRCQAAASARAAAAAIVAWLLGKRQSPPGGQCTGGAERLVHRPARTLLVHPGLE